MGVLEQAVLLFFCAIYGALGCAYLLLLWVTKGSAYFRPQISSPQSTSLQSSSSIGKHVIKEINSRGIKLHYVTLGDQNRPLIVFLHGFPDIWHTWRHQLRHFGSKYWVVAPDMRGYGGSDKPTDQSAYRIVELAEDIKELIKSLGRSKAVIVAHDWGGAVAWRVAQQFPEVVERLVVVNCPHPAAMRTVLRSSLRQFASSWYMLFFQLPYLPELMLSRNNFEIFDKVLKKSKSKGFTTNEDLLYMKSIWAKSGLTSAINYYRANILKSNASMRNDSKRIKMPTLILWGEKDPYLTIQTMLESVRYVDNIKVRIFKDAGHWVFLEEPGEINLQIEKFLEE